MIIARDDFLRDALILDGGLSTMPSASCPDDAALDFLPRRLARWVGVAAALLQRFAPRRQLLVGISMLAAPLRRSMRTRSPVCRSARPPPTAASGEALRIEGEPDVPDWRPRRCRQRSDASDQRGRRLHVHDFGRARIADRAGAAHEQDGVLVDAERGIVDARVIVLGSVEHDGPAFEGIGIVGLDR